MTIGFANESLGELLNELDQINSSTPNSGCGPSSDGSGQGSTASAITVQLNRGMFSFGEVESSEEIQITDPYLLEVIQAGNFQAPSFIFHEDAKTPLVDHRGPVNELAKKDRDVLLDMTRELRYSHNRIAASLFEIDNLSLYESLGTPPFVAILDSATKEPIGIISESNFCMTAEEGKTRIRNYFAEAFRPEMQECNGRNIRINQVFTYHHDKAKGTLDIESKMLSIYDSSSDSIAKAKNYEELISQDFNSNLSEQMEDLIVFIEYRCELQMKENGKFTSDADKKCRQFSRKRAKEMYNLINEER